MIDFKFIECVATAGATILVNFKLEPDIFIDEGRFLSITTERPDKSVNIYALSENQVRVNKFLKAVNSLGTLRVKVEDST